MVPELEFWLLFDHCGCWDSQEGCGVGSDVSWFVIVAVEMATIGSRFPQNSSRTISSDEPQSFYPRICIALSLYLAVATKSKWNELKLSHAPLEDAMSRSGARYKLTYSPPLARAHPNKTA